jgi:hypothetical protein
LKDDIVANQPTPDVDATIECACSYIADLSPRERLQKAGVFAQDFWLADVLK